MANFKAPLQMVRVYWPQGHRVTDTQWYSVYGWVKFLGLISINFPTRFARRGINKIVFLHSNFLAILIRFGEPIIYSRKSLFHIKECTYETSIFPQFWFILVSQSQFVIGWNQACQIKYNWSYFELLQVPLPVCVPVVAKLWSRSKRN